MSSTTYTKEFYKAFVVDAQFFERLNNLLLRHEIHPQVSAKMSDSSVIDELTVAEFIGLPNSKNRKILSVEVSNSYKDNTKFSLVLNREYNAPLSFRIVGDDKDAGYLSTELEKLLLERFKSHSYFSAMHPFHKGAWWALLVSIGTVLVVLPFVSHGYGWLGIVGAAINTIPLIYGRAIGSLFPRAIFKLGDGIERFAAFEARRRMILSFFFVLIGLSILTNFASNVIYDMYWKK